MPDIGHKAMNQTACVEIHYQDRPLALTYFREGNGPVLLYLHGWGQNHQAFLPLIESLGEGYEHIAIDCPGFGASSMSPEAWDTGNYAECVVNLMDQLQIERATLVGHSFGGRVAVRMAHRWPHKVERLILIASAGLKRKVAWTKKLRVQTIQKSAKLLQAIVPNPWGSRLKNAIYQRIASADYQQAGLLRPTLVKVVNEDLAPLLPGIQTNALLMWGEQDLATPPELGQRMSDLLPYAEYVQLPGFDHYSILTRGRHQCAHQIKQFLQTASEMA